MQRTRRFGLGLLVLVTPPAASADPPAQAKAVRVVILSTMASERAIGEWGFSALVEVDGRRLLFDAGNRPDTVLRNARTIGVDLAGVRDVVLCNHHGDHIGGLLEMRRELARNDPAAVSRVHVGKGIFLSRVRASGPEELNTLLLRVRNDYEATGGTFVEHGAPLELWPGVWLTGPVTRVHPERNFGQPTLIRMPDGLVEDTLPEDLSLVVNTERGLVLLTGCGHAGVVNTLYARPPERVAEKAGVSFHKG